MSVQCICTSDLSFPSVACFVLVLMLVDSYMGEKRLLQSVSGYRERDVM